jgi:hypothetical protein
MAKRSLGELKWRMLRRVVRKKKFQYADARNMTRSDDLYFEWLVGNGFVADKGGGWWELSDKGRASAELGFYEI